MNTIDIILSLSVLAAIVAVESKRILHAIFSVGTLCVLIFVFHIKEHALVSGAIQLAVELSILFTVARIFINKGVKFIESGGLVLGRVIFLFFLVTFLAAAFVVSGELLDINSVLSQIMSSFASKLDAQKTSAHLFRAFDMLFILISFFAVIVGVMTVMRKKGHEDKK